MKLSEVDLTQASCPIGIEIEIEDVGKLSLGIPRKNLLEGIILVWHAFSYEIVWNNTHFMQRITLIEFDEKKVKVRISPPHVR